VAAGSSPHVGARGVRSWQSNFLRRRKSTSLTASPEFERVYRNGSVYRGRLFSVHALPNTIGEPRLGLSVSKKVGTAVNRNKVRRRLKEVFRSSAKRLPGNLDFVISARPAAAGASFEELNEEFSRSVHRFCKSAETREAGGVC
jgi:ribonuclease P protein component